MMRALLCAALLFCWGGCRDNADSVAAGSTTTATTTGGYVSQPPPGTGTGSAGTGTGSAGAGTAAGSAGAGTAAGGESPQAVVRRYLDIGRSADLRPLLRDVDPACLGRPVGRVAAVQLMRSRIVVSKIQVGSATISGDTARVPYTVKGSVVRRKKPVVFIDIQGKKRVDRGGALTMKGVSKSGVLHLHRRAGRWLLACPKLARKPSGLIGPDGKPLSVRKRVPTKPHVQRRSPKPPKR